MRIERARRAAYDMLIKRGFCFVISRVNSENTQKCALNPRRSIRYRSNHWPLKITFAVLKALFSQSKNLHKSPKSVSSFDDTPDAMLNV